jgi:hypothetical protein
MSAMKMQFSLTGFSQDEGFRVFAFEGSTADRTKTKFSVRTDLALIQRYGIRVQELPLLCKGLLDRRDEDDQQRTFVFTEKEMCVYANECARAREAALQKRKPPRRPSPNRSEAAGEVHGDQEFASGQIERSLVNG